MLGVKVFKYEDVIAAEEELGRVVLNAYAAPNSCIRASAMEVPWMQPQYLPAKVHKE